MANSITVRRRAKYRNCPTLYNGRKYPSKAEAQRAVELDMLEGANEIRMWVPQVGIDLPLPETRYRVDFLVVGLHATWCEDVKGKETPAFEAHVRRWREYGRCDLVILKRVERRRTAGWKRQVIRGGLMADDDKGSGQG